MQFKNVINVKTIKEEFKCLLRKVVVFGNILPSILQITPWQCVMCATCHAALQSFFRLPSNFHTIQFRPDSKIYNSVHPYLSVGLTN